MKDKIRGIYIVSYQAIREMPFFLKWLTLLCLSGIFFIGGAIIPIGNYKIQDEKAYETLGDLGVYGFMAAEVARNGVEDA